MAHLLLIDGYNFVFRAFHSMPPLTRDDGLEVGAVYGFTAMMIRIMKEFPITHVAMVFDAGVDVFRHQLYAEYKAHRPPAPENLLPQFPLVREATRAFNIKVLEKPGYEADDIIATLTERAKAQGMPVTIVSSDKDLMQLVDDAKNVRMYDPVKKKIINEEVVQEKFGVGPNRVEDVLALIGDSSDNIPGVEGIGPKTATELITRFGSFDQLFANLEQIEQQKRRERLIEQRERAEISRQLVRLHRDVELEYTINELGRNEPNPEVLLPFLQQQGFKSLVPQGLKLPSRQLEKIEHNITITHITDNKQLDLLAAWVKRCKGSEEVYLWYHQNEEEHYLLLGDREAGVTINFTSRNLDSENNLFNQTSQLELAEVAKVLIPLLKTQSLKLVGLNLKALIYSFAGYLQPDQYASCDDLELMAYLVRGPAVTEYLEQLAAKFLPNIDPLFSEVKAKQFWPELIVNSTKAKEVLFLLPYIAAELQQEIFNNKSMELYYQIEKPLLKILAKMEIAGIGADKQVLAQLHKEFQNDANILAGQIYKLAGEEFNIGSPKQLGEVLYDKLGYEGGKKSKKSGFYTTDNEALEALAASGHEIANLIIKWRQLTKLLSTYVEGLSKQIEAKTGRIHTRFMMALTSTGRLSSVNPNLQNIPIRSEEGYKIRAAFKAKPGFTLLSADYSQIELRLLAHMGDIQALKDAFAHNIDIHASTASQIFEVPLIEVNADLRRKAKAINFGIIYGISAFGLAWRLGIDRQSAKKYIDLYFQKYPGIKSYMDSTIEFARQHKYVKTLFNRYCFLKDIDSSNPALRNFTERAAINAPLQGTAADIIKRAMVRIDQELSKHSHQAQLLLQVHDELIFEVKKEELEPVKKLIAEQMQNAVKLSVPLTVNVASGDSWDLIH